jgi:phosphatidylinositol 4-kinase
MRIFQLQFIYLLLIVNWYLVIIVLDSIRNYTILSIAYEESRLFLTRERAPFMLCLEVYRPEEMKFVFNE